MTQQNQPKLLQGNGSGAFGPAGVVSLDEANEDGTEADKTSLLVLSGRDDEQTKIEPAHQDAFAAEGAQAARLETDIPLDGQTQILSSSTAPPTSTATDDATLLATSDWQGGHRTVVDNAVLPFTNEAFDGATQIEPASANFGNPAGNKQTIQESSGQWSGQTQISPSAMAPSKPGDLLNQRYRLEEQLGQGGMGSVFKALDLTQQEVHAKNPYVAIKLLLPSLANDSTLVIGFHREAEKAKKLTHPNIIKVFDANRDGDRHYIVMEYLYGDPLNQIIRDNGAIPLSKAWPIIRDMGLGLAHAHEKNIVHSDFKPANVFILKENQEVKILDFGIASELKKTGDEEKTLFDSRALGGLTTTYASFEMLSGAAVADPRDDIYAFGLVVYELLAGQHPYQRKPATQVNLEKNQGICQPPIQPLGLNKKQWQLLSQVIEIEQKNRPDNLGDWLKAFDPETKTVKGGKKFFPIAVAGVLGILLFAAGLYKWKSIPSTQDVSQQASGKQAQQAIAEPQLSPTPMPALPLANAGADRQGKVGEWVTLDGSASKTADGGMPTGFNWQLVAIPTGSLSSISNSASAAPKFLPDKPGIYRARLSVTDAQGQLSATDDIVVDVAASMPKLQFKTSQDQYRIGQYLATTVEATDNGYLGIVYVSSTGEKLQIFPNGYQQNSQVKSGKSYQVPPKEHRKMLQIQGPTGTDTLVALFSQQPLPDDLDTHVQADGSVTGLSPEVVVEPVHYQIIK